MAAEAWCRKSLAIYTKFGDEHGTAISAGQLGIVAAEFGDSLRAGQQLISSIVTLHRLGDVGTAKMYEATFSAIYARASASDKARLQALFLDAK